MSERFPSARLTRLAPTRPFRQKEKLILELLRVRTQTCWDSPAVWTLLQVQLHCLTFNTLVLLRSSPENQQQLEQPEPSEHRSSYLTVDLSSVTDSCVSRLIYTQTADRVSTCWTDPMLSARTIKLHELWIGSETRQEVRSSQHVGLLMQCSSAGSVQTEHEDSWVWKKMDGFLFVQIQNITIHQNLQHWFSHKNTPERTRC